MKQLHRQPVPKNTFICVVLLIFCDPRSPRFDLIPQFWSEDKKVYVVGVIVIWPYEGIIVRYFALMGVIKLVGQQWSSPGAENSHYSL